MRATTWSTDRAFPASGIDMPPTGERQRTQGRNSPARRRYRVARRAVGGWALRTMGAGALRRLGRSWRYEELGEPPGSGGALVCIWHGRMLCGLERYGSKGWNVLVSPSDDGDLSEHLLERSGYRVVRGSSSRGGARALRELLELLRAGEKVVLTPDGPRGPRHSTNPGVGWLARATGFPVYPIGFACDRAWSLSSWDAFTIPKPRARVCSAWGAPLRVERDADQARLEQVTAELRERLLHAERTAAEHLGGGSGA